VQKLIANTVSLSFALIVAGKVSAQDYIAKFVISHQTGMGQWEGTHDGFSLEIRRANNGICTIYFPSPSSGERQRGVTDTYNLTVPGFRANCQNILAADLALNRISLRINGSDMWTPIWISASAITVQGNHIGLVIGSWPYTLVFSQDPTDVSPALGADARRRNHP